jgi:hypothetical protein
MKFSVSLVCFSDYALGRCLQLYSSSGDDEKYRQVIRVRINAQVALHDHVATHGDADASV